MGHHSIHAQADDYFNQIVPGEYIIDDLGNKITLLNLIKQQIALFPNIGKSSELYNVTGKFKKSYKDLNLEVSNITKGERQVMLIEKK